MQIPLNVIHYYIGIILTAYLAYSGFTKSTSGAGGLTRSFAVSSLLMCLGLCSYGIPPLLTTNSDALSWGIIVGDLFQFAALVTIWFTVIRIYLNAHAVLSRFVKIAVVVCAIVAQVLTTHDNLKHPVTLTQSNGAWNLNYSYLYWYSIFAAIMYASLLFLSIFLWRQSAKIEKRLQRFRVRSFGLLLGGVSLIFISQPLTSGSIAKQETSLLQGAIFLSLLILPAILALLKRFNTDQL